jgi:hypothetical protein
MKTYKQFDDSGLDFNRFCQAGDEVDYDLFEYIGYGWLAPNYADQTYTQNGEPYSGKETKRGTTYYYYETFKHVGDRYFYIGLRADMNKYKPKP